MYEIAIKLEPNKAKYYAQAGDIQQILNQPKLALEMYQKAIDHALAPLKNLYIRKKAQALFQLKQFEDALEIYEVLISKDMHFSMSK